MLYSSIWRRLLIDSVSFGKRPQALLTIVYHSTDCLCRRGAPVRPPSIRVRSLHNQKPGMKHLASERDAELSLCKISWHAGLMNSLLDKRGVIADALNWLRLNGSIRALRALNSGERAFWVPSRIKIWLRKNAIVWLYKSCSNYYSQYWGP